MRSLRTFHLVETEPHPLVAEALSIELFERCWIEEPVPVHFLPMPRWGGMCAAIEDTRAGEVELADRLLDERKDPAGMPDTITHVYLHELSHRLAPGHDHDPAFFAVAALLYMRAGDNRHGRPYMQDLSLYDMQDFGEVDSYTIGEALDWALGQAVELAKADFSAEACAIGIMQRFDEWKAWKADAPKREAEAAAKASAERRNTTATIRGLRELVGQLSGERWRWLAAGVVGGSILDLILMWLLKGA